MTKQFRKNLHFYLHICLKYSNFAADLVIFAIQTRWAELVEQRILETERVKARLKLQETEKTLRK